MSSGHPGTDRWRKTIGRKLGSTVEFTQLRVGQTLHIPCAHGEGHTVDFEINKMMPPEAVVKKMLRDGWTIGSKLVCPDHGRKAKKPNGAACGTAAPPTKEDAVIAAEAKQTPPRGRPEGKPREWSPVREKVCEILAQSSNLTVTEIAGRAGALPKSVDSALTFLLAQGTVERSAQRSGRGGAYRYSLKQLGAASESKEEAMTAPVVGPAARKIIESLEQFSNLTVYDLAELVMVKSNTVNKQLRALFAAGIVSRALGEPDANGHRSYLYSLKTGGGTRPKPEPKKETPMASTPATPTPSEEAKIARRLAHGMIEEHFDVDKGYYRNGWSDRKIAEETGAAPAFVTERRETEFGPLKEPPEITAERERLDAIEQTMTALQEHCARVCENMTRDIAAGRNRLTALIAKNGWRD